MITVTLTKVGDDAPWWSVPMNSLYNARRLLWVMQDANVLGMSWAPLAKADAYHGVGEDGTEQVLEIEVKDE